MGENAGVSNPYAPPEDRRRPAEDESGAHESGSTGTSAPPVDRPADGQHVPHAPLIEPTPPGRDQLPGATSRPTIPTEPVGAEKARRAARMFGLFILGAVALSALPEPARAVALPFVIAAAVFGIRALVLASRAQVRGGLVPMLAGGVTISVIWAFYLSALVVIWPMVADREECMAGALTATAADECTQAFEDDLADLRERARG
jgi:hypothetical protein